MSTTTSPSAPGSGAPPARRKKPSKPPAGPTRRFFRRARLQTVRVVALLLLLVVSGIAIGLLVAFPVSRIQLNSSGAIRLNQANLVGRTDAQAAVISQDDLPVAWAPGDPALAGFGVLGSSFCGKQVPVPTALSSEKSAVFQNSATGATLIGQAVRVDRWQSARDYVAAVNRALKDCDEFYQASFSGPVRSRIEDAPGSPAISDSAGATYRALEAPNGVTEWTILAVGDLLFALTYTGPTASPPSFLDTVENRLLTRVDPEDFAPATAQSPEQSTTVPAAPPTSAGG